MRSELTACRRAVALLFLLIVVLAAFSARDYVTLRAHAARLFVLEQENQLQWDGMSLPGATPRKTGK